MRTPLSAALLVFTACATDDGTPPDISALTYTPETVTVGVQTTVTGSFVFDDADGDLAKLNVEIVAPDDQVHTIAPASIQAIGDLTTGTLPFQMIFAAPMTGVYTFDVWISDDGGHDSNKLPGSLTVE